MRLGVGFFFEGKQQTFIRQLDQHSRWLQCPKQALGSHQANTQTLSDDSREAPNWAS